MKNVIKNILLVSLMILAISSLRASPALAAKTRYCDTSTELTAYVLQMTGDREAYITVSVPNGLPEADMSGYDLLKSILKLDRGYIRWNHRRTAYTKIKSDPSTTTFAYELWYHSTKEQDKEARGSAQAKVSKMNIQDLSDAEKIDRLRAYISENWRYDVTLKNITALQTLKSGKGTCLGLSMASQLLLDAMGVESQGIQGKIAKTGEIHLGLLVKLDQMWYTFDPTDLAQERPRMERYLKNSYDGTFIPNEEFLTESFQRAHPMTAAADEVFC